MTGYVQVNLKELIDRHGEDKVKSILSNFYCPMNKDVQEFLANKAIEFAKQGIAATHLVFASYKNEYVLVGYFSLANKIFNVSPSRISNTMRRRVAKFGQYNQDLKKYIVSAPLIAQLGKNYFNGLNKLITGDELLKIACNKVAEIQLSIGGKIVYLECEDKPALLDFYYCLYSYV